MKNPEKLKGDFVSELRRSNIKPTLVEKTEERWSTLKDKFENRPENRVNGGRQVRQAPRKLVCKTLGQLVIAARDARVDKGPIGEDARKLLRGLPVSPDFEAVETQAKHFIGRRIKEKKRIKDEKEEQGAPRIEMGDGLALRKLVTTKRLIRVSRRLNLCAHDPSMGHLERLKDRSRMFWAIERDGHPVVLLSIDPEEKEVDEANGHDHKPVGLPQPVMLDVLRKLGVTADECEEFSSVGAYSLFLGDSVPEPTEIRLDNSVYRVWGGHGTVVVCQNGKRWSQIRWSDHEDGWVCSSRRDRRDMSQGKLLDLASRCPALADILRKHRLSPGERPISPEPRRFGPRRRRRRM